MEPECTGVCDFESGAGDGRFELEGSTFGSELCVVVGAFERLGKFFDVRLPDDLAL